MLGNLWNHCPTFNITLGCSPANPFIRTWGGMLGLDFHIILVLYSKLPKFDCRHFPPKKLHHCALAQLQGSFYSEPPVQASWESALKISFQKFTFTALSQFRKVHFRKKSREMLEFFPAAIVKIVTKGDLFRTKNAPRKMQNRFLNRGSYLFVYFSMSIKASEVVFDRLWNISANLVDSSFIGSNFVDKFK